MSLCVMTSRAPLPLCLLALLSACIVRGSHPIVSFVSRPHLSRVRPNSALGRQRAAERFIKPVSIQRFSKKWLSLARLSVNQLSLVVIDTPAAVDLPAADVTPINVKAFVASSLFTDFDDIPVLLESPNVWLIPRPDDVG